VGVCRWRRCFQGGAGVRATFAPTRRSVRLLVDLPLLLVTQSSHRHSLTGLYTFTSLLVKILVILLLCILSKISSWLSLSPIVAVTHCSSAASKRAMCWAARISGEFLVFFQDKITLCVINPEQLVALNTDLMLETSCASRAWKIRHLSGLD